MIVHATTLLNLDTVGPDGKVPFERWRGRGHHMGRCVFGERVWYRVGPLTDRTKAEDRMEPGIFVGFRMKSSEYILIANGEATTAPDNQKETCPSIRTHDHFLRMLFLASTAGESSNHWIAIDLSIHLA